MGTNRKTLGVRGEKLASDYLMKQGYHVIEMNYRCRLGEIDIIAEDRRTFVFVEVKTRTNQIFGRPVEAINYKKQNQLYRVAQFYIHSKGICDHDFRFDAIEVILSPDKILELNHIKNIL